MCYHTVKRNECEEVNDITKLELVAAIGPNQLELVQVYLRGLLSAIELEKLIGFMLFFIGIGMIIGMLIAENVVLVVSAGVFLLLGYHLFCH